MAVKWTLHHKRYYRWAWGTLAVFLVGVVLASSELVPQATNPQWLPLILIGIPLGFLLSLRRVKIGNTEEDLRKFEEAELADPYLDWRATIGIKLYRAIRRWWQAWKT